MGTVGMKEQQRRDRFKRIADQLAELIAKTDDQAAHRATAAALLHHKNSGVSWTGFYFLKEGELVVDTDDEIVAGSLLTHAGEVKHQPTAEKLQGVSQ